MHWLVEDNSATLCLVQIPQRDQTNHRPSPQDRRDSVEVGLVPTRTAPTKRAVRLGQTLFLATTKDATGSLSIGLAPLVRVWAQFGRVQGGEGGVEQEPIRPGRRILPRVTTRRVPALDQGRGQAWGSGGSSEYEHEAVPSLANPRLEEVRALD